MSDDRIIDEVDAIADATEAYIGHLARERALAAGIEPDELTRRVHQELADRAEVI